MTAQTQSNVPLLGPLEKVIATTVAVAIIIGIILLLLWRFVFLTIPAGHVGVLFSLLGGGTVKEWVMQEGIAMKWPWNRVFLFEVRTQRIPFEVIALSAEGMTVTVEGAVFFHPKRVDTPEVLDHPWSGLSEPDHSAARPAAPSANRLPSTTRTNSILSITRAAGQIIAELRSHQISEEHCH